MCQTGIPFYYVTVFRRARLNSHKTICVRNVKISNMDTKLNCVYLLKSVT